MPSGGGGGRRGGPVPAGTGRAAVNEIHTREARSGALLARSSVCGKPARRPVGRALWAELCSCLAWWATAIWAVLTAVAATGCAVRDGGLETTIWCGRAGASGACTLYEFGIVVPVGMRLLLQVTTAVALDAMRQPHPLRRLVSPGGAGPFGWHTSCPRRRRNARTASAVREIAASEPPGWAPAAVRWVPKCLWPREAADGSITPAAVSTAGRRAACVFVLAAWLAGFASAAWWVVVFSVAGALELPEVGYRVGAVTLPPPGWLLRDPLGRVQWRLWRSNRRRSGGTRIPGGWAPAGQHPCETLFRKRKRGHHVYWDCEAGEREQEAWMGAIQTWCWWRLLISSLVSVGALAGGIGGASVAAAAIGIARVLATDWHARRAAVGVAQGGCVGLGLWAALPWLPAAAVVMAASGVSIAAVAVLAHATRAGCWVAQHGPARRAERRRRYFWPGLPWREIAGGLPPLVRGAFAVMVQRGGGAVAGWAGSAGASDRSSCACWF